MGGDAFAPVAVVGAGPAGLTIARLLALNGKRVFIVDPETGNCDRLEILPPSSLGIVAALDLADLLEDPIVARPCAGIRRRWISREIEYDDFLRHRGGRGFVVDRGEFDAHLRARCRKLDVAHIRGRVIGVRRNGPTFELHVNRGEGATTLLSRLVVDATGRSASVGRRLGSHRMVSERLVAERRTVESSQVPSQSPMWLDVQAMETAWQYALTGPDGRTETWDVHRGRRRRLGLNAVVNASSTHLSPAAGDGWIAVGDAAVAFDPIASQGLANALSSALVAAGAIISAGGVTSVVASTYSDVVSATFAHSESGRRAVYDSMDGRERYAASGCGSSHDGIVKLGRNGTDAGDVRESQRHIIGASTLIS